MDSLKKINIGRYDRNDVIPVAAFDFQDQKAYTLENAMWLAEMASLAYEKDSARADTAIDRLWGFRKPKEDGPVFSYGADFEEGRFDDHGASQVHIQARVCHRRRA